ncbi:hypothetical protein HELRODRAFT_164537 [Helobdella robusta]|uniref:Uncharacterized protein n=1 Tax=Helobdella robusta TaxID=6412 RepID=T1EVJ9_HELRO|nr:hypothetical protein HELRODRAFT_164537 [Helobdella robusta]ESN94658.1 hypothetical protein HELRODRAFT_164537 [Helobdella robusta]
MPRNVCNNNNTFDATNNNNNNNRINTKTGNCSLYFRFCLSYYLQTHDSTNCNLAVGYSKVFFDTRSVDNQIDLNTVPNKPIFESQNGEWERGKVVFLTSLNNSLFFEFYFDKPWQLYDKHIPRVVLIKCCHLGQIRAPCVAYVNGALIVGLQLHVMGEDPVQSNLVNAALPTSWFFIECGAMKKFFQ